MEMLVWVINKGRGITLLMRVLKSIFFNETLDVIIPRADFFFALRYSVLVKNCWNYICQHVDIELLSRLSVVVTAISEIYKILRMY